MLQPPPLPTSQYRIQLGSPPPHLLGPLDGQPLQCRSQLGGSLLGGENAPTATTCRGRGRGAVSWVAPSWGLRTPPPPPPAGGRGSRKGKGEGEGCSQLGGSLLGVENAPTATTCRGEGE